MQETPIDTVEASVVIKAMQDRTAPKAGLAPEPVSRRSFVTLVVLLGSMSALGPLAIDMYLPSFPSLAEELGTSIGSVQQTLAVYFVGLAAGQLFYGPASDRFGRKLPLNVGLLIFGLASVGCGFAMSLPSLVALRLLQALGGCAQMVIARAMVRDLFNDRDATRVFSSLILVMGLVPILAPLAGGWMITHWSWRAIFFVQALAAAICLVTVNLLLRESLPAERRQRDSVVGTLASYGRLLKHRSFMALSFTVGLMSAGLFAYVGGSPFVLMEIYGVQASHFGFVFGSNAAGLILASQVNGWLVARVAPAAILRAVLPVSVTAAVLLVLASRVPSLGLWAFMPPLFIFVASLGFVFPTATALVMAPHGRNAGNASALLGCIQFGLSAAGGMLVSLLQNHSALPMTLVIAGASAAAWLIHRVYARSAIEITYPADPVSQRCDLGCEA